MLNFPQIHPRSESILSNELWCRLTAAFLSARIGRRWDGPDTGKRGRSADGGRPTIDWNSRIKDDTSQAQLVPAFLLSGHPKSFEYLVVTDSSHLTQHLHSKLFDLPRSSTTPPKTPPPPRQPQLRCHPTMHTSANLRNEPYRGIDTSGQLNHSWQRKSLVKTDPPLKTTAVTTARGAIFPRDLVARHPTSITAVRYVRNMVKYREIYIRRHSPNPCLSQSML